MDPTGSKDRQGSKDPRAVYVSSFQYSHSAMFYVIHIESVISPISRLFENIERPCVPDHLTAHLNSTCT